MADSHDQLLREHVIYLLDGGGAHAKFDDVMKDFPVKIRGQKPPGLPHTPWMLLEHLRIAQWDILEFSRNGKHKSPEFPQGYWPQTESPTNAGAWETSIQGFLKDLKAMRDLVENPKTDLFTKIPWGDGQTILREALLLADHNAYHLGQLVDARRAQGAWGG
ncbi:MAG TPA: DinB family protein [Terriglobales bacterium]|nr:DinB family protein [Terriglobales bacterium]